MAVGLTRFWPLYFGARPWSASEPALSGPMFPAQADPEAADEAGREVADDVTVEVRRTRARRTPRDAERGPCRRRRPGSPRARNLRVLRRDLAEGLEEEAVGELHDVVRLLASSQTRLRPCSRAYSNAKRMIRSEPGRLIGLTEMPEPGAICFFCSLFELRRSRALRSGSCPPRTRFRRRGPSVFSRTSTRSTLS